MGGQPVVVPTTAHNGSATSSTTTGNAPSSTQATDNTASSTATGSRKMSSPIATAIPDEFKGSSYEELIPHLEKKVAEYKPLTEEELKKLRKKQRAEGVISGISDAVRSVANLIATHNYAPNMYNPTDGMSARAKARFEKEKAEREAEEDRWFNYAMTLGKLRGADKDRGLQIWQTEQGLARQARQDEREEELRPFKVATAENQATKEGNLAKKAGYEADKAKTVAKYAPQQEEGKLELLHAKTGQANAAAANSLASAAAHGRQHPVRHFLGKEYDQNSDDFKKDVWRAAREYNERKKGEDQIALQEEDPTTSGYKMRDKDAADVAADVERRIALEEREKRKNSYRRGSSGKPPLD